jgi:hypothetical protein
MKRICMPALFAALSVTASAATFSIENETLAVSYDDTANSFYVTEKAFARDIPFRQELKLRDGQILITAGDQTLRVFVNTDAPVIPVIGSGVTPRAGGRDVLGGRNK